MGKTSWEKQKKRDRNARFYEKNKHEILEKRKEQRRRKKPRIAVEEQSEGALPKPIWRLYKARQRARKRQEKEKTSSKSIAVSPNAVRGAFANRTARQRAVNTTKNNLPSSPRRKVTVVASLVTSPSTRQSLKRLGYVNSPEVPDNNCYPYPCLRKWCCQHTLEDGKNQGSAVNHLYIDNCCKGSHQPGDAFNSTFLIKNKNKKKKKEKK